MQDKDFDKKFVTTWLQAVSEGRGTDWVANELQVNVGFASNKSRSLRRRGVKLPSLKSGKYTISPEHVSELNDLIDNEGTKDHPDLTRKDTV